MAFDDSLIVTQTGTTITTSGVSAAATIPNNSANSVPRFVYVAATAAAYVHFGATSTAGDMLIQPGDAQVLTVPKGVTQISAIQVSAAGVVQISPLEN